jgi:hypothetical protein
MPWAAWNQGVGGGSTGILHWLNVGKIIDKASKKLYSMI